MAKLSVATSIWLAGLVAQAIAPPTAQEPPIRAGVNLVRVDVSVLDKHREPVEDLTASDFTIRDEGAERPVVAFSRVRLVAGVAPADGDPSAGSADEAPRNASLPDERGRLVVILFDRTTPAGDSTLLARRIASSLVRSLAPGDYAAIIRSSGFSNEGRSQEFTQDRAALLRAIESPFVGMTSPPVMTSDGLRDGSPREPTGECLCGVCALDAVADVARAIQADLGRRKMLVFIGSDMPFMSENRECGPRLRPARQRLFRELDLSNLTVHVLDPTGLEAGGVPAASFSRTGSLAQAAVAQQTRDRLDRQGNLAVLPERTGGRLVTNANDPDAFAGEILNESRSYYLLGFEPAAAADDKAHRIEVTVKRNGVRVIARKSYLPAKR